VQHDSINDHFLGGLGPSLRAELPVADGEVGVHTVQELAFVRKIALQLMQLLPGPFGVTLVERADRFLESFEGFLEAFDF
jgi:hypothetical protein